MCNTCVGASHISIERLRSNASIFYFISALCGNGAFGSRGVRVMTVCVCMLRPIFRQYEATMVGRSLYIHHNRSTQGGETQLTLLMPFAKSNNMEHIQFTWLGGWPPTSVAADIFVLSSSCFASNTSPAEQLTTSTKQQYGNTHIHNDIYIYIFKIIQWEKFTP